MMPRPLLRLALAAALFAPLVASAQSAGLYVVQPGDTLFRISRAHDLTVEQLRQLNRLDGDYISVGQTLRVTDRVPLPAQGPPQTPPQTVPTPAREQTAPVQPSATTPSTTPVTAPAPAGTVHVVAAGETLFRIALQYDTTVDELRRLNRIEGDQIAVGQRLVVGGAARPARAEGASGPVRLGAPRPWSLTDTTVPADLVHFVEPGETLYSIAAAYGVSVDALTAGNALSTAPLAPGTPLYLPARVNPADAVRRALPPVEDEGLALVYPDVMAGRQTENGEVYDPAAFTVSHREYPFGTVLLVTNPATGRSTFVRVIDRGPVSQAYLVELSEAAALALALDPDEAQRVELRRVP